MIISCLKFVLYVSLQFSYLFIFSRFSKGDLLCVVFK